MSVLRSLTVEDQIAHIRTLLLDKSWSPPTYIFLDKMLQEVTIVNWCTVLDDADAIDLFGLAVVAGAVYLQRKVDDKYNYALVPVQYDPETHTVNPLGG